MKTDRDRRGTALVELAIFLPVYFLVVMATIETCRMIYIRQSLKIAAYECGRLGIIPGMTSTDLQTQCDAVLQGRRLKNYGVSTHPSDIQTLRYGDILTTSISLSTRDNSLVAPWFYRAPSVSESVQIMAEHDKRN